MASLTRERQDNAVNLTGSRWYQSIAPVAPVITLKAFSAEMSDSSSSVMVLQSFRPFFNCDRLEALRTHFNNALYRPKARYYYSCLSSQNIKTYHFSDKEDDATSADKREDL